MAGNDNDLQVMKAVAKGDEAAMAALITRWQGPVLGYVCRFLSCQREEARDLTQEVFLRVWENRRRWQPTARFSTWLFTIVSNLCRNQLRTAERRPFLVTLDDQLIHEHRSGPEFDPSALAEASQLAKRIHQGLAELPENQRAALLLKRIEGLSYREIANILEVSESAVESLLVRARRALSKKIPSQAQEKPKASVKPGEEE